MSRIVYCSAPLLLDYQLACCPMSNTGIITTNKMQRKLKKYQYQRVNRHLFLQETADEIVDIFSQSEPSQLVSVCVSPALINISPSRTLQILQHLEDTIGVSVLLTIVMATMSLLMDDLPQYTQLMDRHTEVRVSAETNLFSVWALLAVFRHCLPFLVLLSDTTTDWFP